MGERSSIDLHFDNQQLAFPGYDELRVLIDRSTILSFFLTIAQPAAGGQLVVYEHRWTPDDDTRQPPMPAPPRSPQQRSGYAQEILWCSTRDDSCTKSPRW